MGGDIVPIILWRSNNKEQNKTTEFVFVQALKANEGFHRKGIVA